MITESVASDLVGRSCGGTLEATNNESVHEGNKLIITTGDQTYEFPDVEASSGTITIAEGTVVLGETIEVGLELGDSGVTSGGIEISLTCPAVVETTTTTEAETTTTTLPLTTDPSAVTTQPNYTG